MENLKFIKDEKGEMFININSIVSIRKYKDDFKAEVLLPNGEWVKIKMLYDELKDKLTIIF